MKLSLVCVSLAALFAGCVSEPFLPGEESDPEDTPYHKEAPGGEGYVGEGFIDPCHMVIHEEFTFDGETYTIAIPVMCDPNPFQDRGDPPPDEVRNPSEIYVNPADQYQNNIDPNEDSSSLI